MSVLACGEMLKLSNVETVVVSIGKDIRGLDEVCDPRSIGRYFELLINDPSCSNAVLYGERTELSRFHLSGHERH